MKIRAGGPRASFEACDPKNRAGANLFIIARHGVVIYPYFGLI
jgi:hypothetical protein